MASTTTPKVIRAIERTQNETNEYFEGVRALAAGALALLPADPMLLFSSPLDDDTRLNVRDGIAYAREILKITMDRASYFGSCADGDMQSIAELVTKLEVAEHA